MNRKDYYSTAYKKNAINADLAGGEKLTDILPANIKNKKILDVGCGPGVTLKFLTQNNEIVGVDIIDEYLKIAKENGFSKIICHNVEEGLPFENECFDIVVCTDLLEHVFNTEFVLQEIKRVMKKDGFAVLAVPNHNYWYMRLRFLFGKGIRWPSHKTEDWNYFHVRFFTWDSWNNFLKKNNLEIVESIVYPRKITIPLIRVEIPERISSKLTNKFPNFFGMRFMAKVIKT